MKDAFFYPIARNRKKRGEGASRHGEILAAAKRVFLIEGFERATMRRIAAEVGVSPTALYVYFRDKEAILRAIAEATFVDLLAAVQASQNPQDAPRLRLRAGMRAYVSFGIARPDEYRLTFLSKRMPVPGEAGRHDIPAAGQSFELLERVVAEALHSGDLPARPAPALAESIWACAHGVTALLLDCGAHVFTPPDELIETVLDLVTGAITK